MPGKTVSLEQIFTDAELEKAWQMFRTTPPRQFVTKCAEEIIVPVLPRINKALGQANDPRFLAYAVYYVFSGAPK